MKAKIPHWNLKFATLFKSNVRSDVCFTKDDIQIPAHKFMLAASSDVFERMFYGEFDPANEIPIEETIESFTEFLQFFYLDEVDLTPECIHEVIKLVDKYNVKECMGICEDLFNQFVTKNTICSYLDTALTFNLSTNTLEFLDAMMSRETKQIVETDGFKYCSRDVLKRILSLNEVECDETTIFESAMNWASFDCAGLGLMDNIENRKRSLDDCFNLIRFPVMTAMQFADCIQHYPTVLESDEYLDILQYITSKRQMTIAVKFSTAQRQKIVLKVFAERDYWKPNKGIFEFGVQFSQPVELTQIRFALRKADYDELKSDVLIQIDFIDCDYAYGHETNILQKTFGKIFDLPIKRVEDNGIGSYKIPIDRLRLRNNSQYRLKISSSSYSYRSPSELEAIQRGEDRLYKYVKSRNVLNDHDIVELVFEPAVHI